MYNFFIWLSLLYGGYTIYNLSLTIVGMHNSLRKTILPVMIYTVLIYTYKLFFFNSFPVLHTIAIAVTCILVVRVFNNTSWHLSLIGTVLTFIVIIFASNLIICPIALQFGINISSEVSNNMDWIMLSYIETTPACLLLIFLKYKQFSIVKFLNYIEGK